MEPLLLASTSPYRRALLERLAIPFEVDAPSFDERSLDPEFAARGVDAFATRLALGKAQSLVPRWPRHWILAADQVAVLPGPPDRLLHKPGTKARAVDQLTAMSGRRHTLTTAVVLLAPGGASWTEDLDHQNLFMRTFSSTEAHAYVDRYAPLDCAGSYRIEDAGIRLFEGIDGHDVTGIMGLPLLAVCRLLRAQGLLLDDHYGSDGD